MCAKHEKTHMLNQSAFMLEGVPFAEMVQFVVEVLIDLAGRTIFD